METRHRKPDTALEAADALALPRLLKLKDVSRVEGPVEQGLETTYFDTPGLALTAAGIAVCRRAGGDEEGWRLWLPAADGGSDELLVPLGRAVTTVPKPLREAVELYARGQELAPIVRIRVSREEHRLHDSKDRELVRLHDDRVSAEDLVTEDGPTTTRREWGLKRVAGKRRHLEDAARMLEKTGAEPVAGGTEPGRLLRERLPQADVTDQPRLRRGSPAAFVVQARLREQVARLQHQDPLVRRDVVGSVHKMRVAARRLRSALASYRPLLDNEQTEALREELGWISRVLGDVRDAEVMHRRLEELVAEESREDVIGPVKRRIRGDLKEAYRTAHDRCVEAMRSPRYLALVDDLDVLVEDPPWADPAARTVEDVLVARLKHDFKRLRRRVTAAEKAADAAGRDEALHEVRKAAKRVRYATEALFPVHGRPARRFAKAVKGLQSTLGDHHDAVVTQPMLRQLAVRAQRDGESSFTYGRLHERERRRAANLEEKVDAAWSRASHEKLRRWLG